MGNSTVDKLAWIIGIKNLSSRQVEGINLLLKQLSALPAESTRPKLRSILNQSGFTMVLVEDPEADHRVIGIACVTVSATPMRTTAYIDDVVVDEKYRGQGIAKLMTKYLIAIARIKNAEYVSLTSNPNNPKRVVAIKMYEGLDFKLIGTVGSSNYYRLYL
ncbi:hypothetical protein A3H53_04020 [Candidatus Nomurabacteria bacterium RIFCSPLOWO2_02_FULL_40_10]|uniref:N-acetyltransferase domain-containing protein n=1 Tax=Candidatus Nomurabacteria bacterium RIFCSPLOWO2_02_FULL_40_10 TaxID=1801786 RepID=A0A1F6Y159_9BACT|nr:MAG: hypothetical protein A3H53_04020 [Candidatus Nomurabacteria bacterium RIFCSPLOWO2_02_FULL_40_10]